MMPTNVAARMTLAADPGSLQGAVAAGILGAGPVVLGTSEECARLLAPRVTGAIPPRSAREIRAAGGKVPGFGHPVHKPLDPRAERILELADERGVSGPHVELARAFRDAVAEEWGKPLTMNVSMPIAAVLLDLGFPPDAVKAVPILARTASLLAHLAEEREQPIGFAAWPRAAEEAVEYRVMLEPAVETRPWEEQLALDDAAYREQLEYLLERSPFYSEKLAAPTGGARRDRRAAADGEGASCARRVTPENPFGAHLCASRARSSASTRRAARPARRATSR